MTKKSKKAALLETGQSASEALRAILQHNFKHLLTWQDAARSWQDIEGVHQVRVSLRRMRSAFQVFRPAVPRQVSRPWADEMRWLANQLGPARDLDVFISEGLVAVEGKLPVAGAEKMISLAQQRREQAYRQVVAMLDGERYAQFKNTFVDWIETQGWRQDPLERKLIKRLDSGVIHFARDILDKQERQVLKTGTHANRDSTEDLHRLRIECKKLRYATEFFMELFRGMDGFIKHMKGLQDLLGVMNDIAVMEQLMDDLLSANENLEVSQYAGALIGWRTRQFYEIKDTFDERWHEFVNAKHPWWK